jgi:hypothetical protein
LLTQLSRKTSGCKPGFLHDRGDDYAGSRNRLSLKKP